MIDKPPYARNCVFNQCIQPAICDASQACIWNASDVPMIEGTVIAKQRNPFDDMPKAIPTRIAYIVWNAARTEGYITFDQGVAYEARKGAESNCFDANGTQMKLAQAFCEIYSSTDDATKQIVVISEPPEYPGD